MGFSFSYDFVRSSGLTDHSLDDFVSTLKTVDISSLLFHLERGDFERWIRQVIGDEKLANKIAEIMRLDKRLKGSNLRKKILAVTTRRIKQLKRIKDKLSTDLKRNK